MTSAMCLHEHGIECSMSARGSCYDNAPLESFFSLLKRERVRRRTYRTREEAKADIFDYIERFYNRERSHSYLGYLSPVQYREPDSEDLIKWSELLGPYQTARTSRSFVSALLHLLDEINAGA